MSERSPLTPRNHKSLQVGIQRPASVIVRIAVWFAILTGLAEVMLLALAQSALHRYVYFMGTYLLWMAPVGYMVVFLPPTLLLLALAWRWPKLVSLRLIMTVFAFVSFLSLLLLVTQLAPVAALVLAAGLAVQAGRLAAAHYERVSSLVRRAIGWVGPRGRRVEPVQAEATTSDAPSSAAQLTRRQFLIGTGTTLTGLVVGAVGWDRLSENRALAGLPPASRNAPNVLMVILDTVRAQNLSLYDYHRPTTPNLERLAQNGVVFERAIASAPWTLPSHASMFTARHPHELGVGFASGLDGTYPTLAEVLSRNGYTTAGFVSNVWYCSRASGLARGFTHYEDFALSAGQIVNSASLGRAIAATEGLRRALGYHEDLGRKYAPEMNDRFLRWLSQRDPQRPFFAFLNYFDAHEPYLPPQPFDRLFGDNLPRANLRHNVEWQWTAAQVQAELDAYDNAIAYLDHHIGLLFDELQERGLLNNTLVIIAGDHGEEFNEHGLMDHAYSLYWPALHVPLLLSFPGRVPTGALVREPACLRDLAATVLDLLGMQANSPFPGASLARYWQSAQSGQKEAGARKLAEYAILSEVDYTPGYPDWYPISKGDMRSLFVEGFRYIRNGDGREELYDVETDALEQENLVDATEYRERLEGLRESLKSLLNPTRNEP